MRDRNYPIAAIVCTNLGSIKVRSGDGCLIPPGTAADLNGIYFPGLDISNRDRWTCQTSHNGDAGSWDSAIGNRESA